MTFRILVVEDEATNRHAMAALLAGAGYEVDETGSVSEALATMERASPDLIITDVRLADDNGLYLAAINPHRIPVVIVTGYPDAGLAYEARELGAEFLLKPIRPSQLLSIVERRLPPSADGQEYAFARRWPRRRPTKELKALIDETFVRVVDVSYGGMRLTASRTASVLEQRAFCITFPSVALSLPARVVWQRPTESGRMCGATVPEEWQLDWREFVDAVS